MGTYQKGIVSMYITQLLAEFTHVSRFTFDSLLYKCYTVRDAICDSMETQNLGSFIQFLPLLCKSIAPTILLVCILMIVKVYHLSAYI